MKIRSRPPRPPALKCHSGAAVPLAEASIVNLLLLGPDAVQHCVMAQRGFKRWSTRFALHAVFWLGWAMLPIHGRDAAGH